MKVISMIAEIEKLQGSEVKSFSPRDQMAEQVRQQVKKGHTADFPMFVGLKYSEKSDRYVATFSGFESQGGKSCSVKVSNDVAKFLLENNDRKACHWYLTLVSPINGAVVVTDVDILTYD